MASYSLMVGSNVGRGTILKDASRSTTGKKVASPNTSGASVSSRPINPKLDVQPVPDSEFAMVYTSKTPRTSQAYGRNLRLPITPKSVLKPLVMGLALLSGKGMAEPCDDPPKTFYERDLCGVNNSYTSGCNVDSRFFILGSQMLPHQSNGNCTKDDGTIFPLFQPNSINATCTDWQLLNEVKSQSIVGVNKCNSNYLMTYCVPWLELALNQSHNLSECANGTVLPPTLSPTQPPTPPEDRIRLSVGDFSLGSLGTLIFCQLLFLGIDMYFSKSQKVESHNGVGTVDYIKNRIRDEDKYGSAKDVVQTRIKAINERLQRKYFTKNLISTWIKVALGIASAVIDANECDYGKRPSSMISNYYFMSAVVDFLTTKFDQKAWTECLSGHGYNAITNDCLEDQLATVLVKAKDGNDDQTIEQFINIVHSSVELADMVKMGMHVLPILFSVCLFSATAEKFSTCEDDRFNKDLFWALPMVLALDKGLFDVFCYPTELAVHKKDELGRFAVRILDDESGADIELDNLEEQPLIASDDDESSNKGGSDEGIDGQ